MNRALPWAALVITVVIWAGYLVVTRAAMNADLGPVDVGLLRSVPAAILMLPYLIRHGPMPHGTRIIDVFGIGVLGGIVFIICLSIGLDFAPVADSGIFAPSMLPVFITAFGILFFRETRTRLQFAGLALIITGALAVGGWSAITTGAQNAWIGHILFLCASALWAIYTLIYRSSSLSAIAATAVMAAWSSAFFLMMIPFTGLKLFDLPPLALSIQVIQGIASGLVANFTFLYAVKRLGSTIPAASAALVPILAAIGGQIFLQETLNTTKMVGIAIVVLGIILASGILKQTWAKQ